MRRLRAHLSYANVMSSIAVFLVLGGSAYAAATLPKNSVGSRQIKSNAVTSSKVKNGSLLSKDFKAGQLPKGSKGDTGAQGPKGDTGTTGAKGDKGDKGDTGTAGPVTGDLPSGTTLRGNYAVRLDGATTGSGWTAVSFGLRLPSDPTVHVVPAGGPKPPECQGTIYMPQAAPGHFCVYRQFENGLSAPSVLRMADSVNEDSATAVSGNAGRTGAYLDFGLLGTTFHLARGSWAVTAP